MQPDARIFDEPLWASFYHALALEGKAETLWQNGSETSWLVAIREEDRLEFPTLPALARFVYVLDSKAGFVWTRTLTKTEALQERKDSR